MWRGRKGWTCVPSGLGDTTPGGTCRYIGYHNNSHPMQLPILQEQEILEERHGIPFFSPRRYTHKGQGWTHEPSIYFPSLPLFFP